MQSFVAAAEVLKESGACKIYVLATHGLLSSDAPRLIEESPIDEVKSNRYLIISSYLMDYFAIIIVGGGNEYHSSRNPKTTMP